MLLNERNKFLRTNGYLLVIAASLFVLSFLVDAIWPTKHSIAGIQKAIQSDIRNKQTDFSTFCSHTEIIDRLITGDYPTEELAELTDKKYFIFIFPENAISEPSPIFWNTQQISPPVEILYGRDSSLFSKLQNGWYVIERKTYHRSSSAYKIIALIPVKWEYYITNNYLHNSFSVSPSATDKIDISKENTDKKITGRDGKTLFYLNEISSSQVTYNNPISVILKLLAALFILFFINNLSHLLVVSKGLWKGFGFFAASVIVLRAITYYLPIPVDVKQFELFTPAIYGSTRILRSLGDLLINTGLMAWAVLFFRYHLKPGNFKELIKNRIVQIVILILVIILVTFVSARIIRSLVSDSQISFDVLNFFSLNIYTVIGFTVLCCIAIGYFFIIEIIFNLYSRFFSNYFRLALLFSAISLVIAFFITGTELFSFFFFLMLWLLLFLYLMSITALRSFTSKIISSKIIFWLFFFSASITTLIVIQNDTKEMEARKQFARNIANKMDPYGELIMNITLTDFRSDQLADIFQRFNDKADNRYLKDSLVNENFSGITNKFETRVYTFDANERILYNEDPTPYNTLNAIVETQAKPTSTPGLMYYDVSFDHFNYINKKVVKGKDSSLLGYLFIISHPKNYKQDALYPQLFTKGSTASPENSPTYAYAVYVNNRLINSHNDYPFQTSLHEQNLHTDFWERRNNNYSELWYKADLNKIIVIAKSDNSSIEEITLFAYLFCGFLFVIVIINLITLLIKNKFNLYKALFSSSLSIRSQVQSIIVAISILSFIIIGITTILFFIERYNKNNREQLSKTINVMQNEVRSLLDTLPYNANKGQNESFHQKLGQEVNKIAETHSTDINIYDLKGNLQVSSLALPYSKGILSTIMDPIAYYHLNKLKDVQYFREQKIGDLKYLNNYVPVRNEKGEEYAYLNIPYFESQNKLEEEISNFLVTIINLNAFIFIIAAIIAFFITNRITRSFFFLSNKMKEVNIGKINEVISWNRKDEIGELVNEYNKMVHKLEESAQKLARTEREGAWREMARQVAHEIKNPLTPMKLNLQYLQMAIENNSPDIKNISHKVASVLVEQIDHLSKIASDFAQFANINSSTDEVFDLNDLLTQLVELYSANKNLKLTFERAEGNLLIKADKTQIHRLFTNLLQNAIQSVPETKEARVDINISRDDGNIIVSITDNGSGIPKEMQSKIFTPNFTTKTSGTGLGLAMCKGIVEKINGDILFKTQEGKGSTFFVKLPLTKV